MRGAGTIPHQAVAKARNLQRVIAAQEEGFVAFSQARVVVPDVFYMPFDDTRPGGLHVRWLLRSSRSYSTMAMCSSCIHRCSDSLHVLCPEQ